MDQKIVNEDVEVRVWEYSHPYTKQLAATKK
jgi:hypothetical protein